MKTLLLTAEKNVRKAVFTTTWKFFGVKSLSDLALLGMGAAVLGGIVTVVIAAISRYW